MDRIDVRLESCGAHLFRLCAGSGDVARVSYLAGRAPAGAPVATIPHLHPAPDGIIAGDGLAVRLRLDHVQHFYGLGEGGQQFDRLGATRRLWNNQGNHGQAGADIAIPLLLSSAGYALFFDNASAGEIVAGSSIGGAWIEARFATGPLVLYLIEGADPAAVLGGVADLLGHAPMPPRWALGFMQSTRHFDSPEEPLSVARGLRAKRLPCDVLIFLSTYGAGKGWNRAVGQLDWQPDLVPDPDALMAELRGMGFRIFSHEYPALHADSPLYAEAVREGFLLDWGYPDERPYPPGTVAYREGQRFIDFSSPPARRWWWRAHRDLLDQGIEGWWLDGGEGPPAETVLAQGAGREVHNRFDLLRQQAFAEGEAADAPQRRAFLLCRSGGPGMQRFGAAAWSGDIACSFPTLEMQVPVGLNLGLSGVPFWGTDIGGFYQVERPDTELYLRWFAFGAFCPLFRAHGHSWRDHLPWAHGPEAEAICRGFLELRYALMPYTYTLAWQAHTRGLPLMRPLVLTHPGDTTGAQLGSQYCWGNDLLVAPVTRAGATHWPVYLPAGTWFDFWTGERHDGARAITVAAPLDRIPLFVRGGAIIPMAPVVQYDGERPGERIALLIHPEPGRHEGMFYEDDGATRAYAQGQHAITRVAATAEQAGLSVTIGPPEGDPTVVPAGRLHALRIRTDRVPREVTWGGHPVAWAATETGFVAIADIPAGETVVVAWR
jgi:alpha-glucosidase (family GH31 glycosyl hydrolase)